MQITIHNCSMKLKKKPFKLFVSTMLVALWGSMTFATTIIPFPNLGEMAKASDAVVVAKAIRNFEKEMNGWIRFRTQFEIKDKISGEIEAYFEVQNMHLKNELMERRVDGDVTFKEGETYLLFLHQSNYGYWQTKMLSYALFVEREKDGQQLLVPVSEGLNYFQYSRPDGQKIEPLKVYDRNGFCSHLKEVLAGSSVWNQELVATPFPNSNFNSGEFRSPPTHCRYLNDPEPPAFRGSPPWPRWQGFESNTPLPVYYHSGGDSGCGSAIGKVQGSIANLNANYIHINLTDGGTHSYVPSDCSEGAAGSEFTDWVAANLGTSRAILVQFNDPCNEIPNLSGCSGVLAFGGTWWSGSTHTHDGIQWNNAGYGFVVTNNDFGTCFCNSGTNYDIVIDHEMTHALCAGHIDPLVANSGGVANMNPSCCNTIQTLDVQCLDYTYGPLLPVELIDFTAQKESLSVALQWQTASEKNNDHFLLQRSVEGRAFETVGKIPGAGNSQNLKDYHFIDQEPGDGLNYYRLKQVDFDGHFEYSEVRSVRFDFVGEQISVYPNPLDGELINVRFTSPAEWEFDVELMDVNGTLLFQQKQFLEKGVNKLQFSLSEHPSGVYWLRFNYGPNTHTERIVKL